MVNVDFVDRATSLFDSLQEEAFAPEHGDPLVPPALRKAEHHFMPSETRILSAVNNVLES